MQKIQYISIIILLLTNSASYASAMTTQNQQDIKIKSSSEQSEEELSNTLKILVNRLINENAYFSILYSKDKKFKLDSQFLQNKKINSKMRKKLVKWMDDLCDDFQFKHETFFLAVAILDKYLHVSEQTTKELQLVGATVVYIASKISETKIVTPQAYAYSSGDIFSQNEVFSKQKQILVKLGFKTDFPIAMKYLRHLGVQLTQQEYYQCIQLLSILQGSVDSYNYSRLQLAQFVIVLVKTGHIQGLSLEQLVDQIYRLDKLFD